MLAWLCQAAKDELLGALTLKESSFFATLIVLNHVRDRPKYMKNLAQMQQSGLKIQIWDLSGFRKRNNYWILLEGTKIDKLELKLAKKMLVCNIFKFELL